MTKRSINLRGHGPADGGLLGKVGLALRELDAARLRIQELEAELDSVTTRGRELVEEAERERDQALRTVLEMAVQGGAVIHRKGQDGWEEWVRHLGDQVDADFKPRSLFVRLQDGLIDVIDSRVTSGNPGARELEGDQTREGLTLRFDDARWLVEALTLALGAGTQQPGNHDPSCPMARLSKVAGVCTCTAISGEPPPWADEADAVTVFETTSGHDGPGWYYVIDDYQDEGSVGAFATQAEAEAHAKEAGHVVTPPTEQGEADDRCEACNGKGKLWVGGLGLQDCIECAAAGKQISGEPPPPAERDGAAWDAEDQALAMASKPVLEGAEQGEADCKHEALILQKLGGDYCSACGATVPRTGAGRQ